MKKAFAVIAVIAVSLFLAFSSVQAADMAEALSAVLSQGPANGFWQVSADDLLGWINAKKTDFLVVDVRANPQDYKAGHIPGSIAIPVQDILKADSLKKLPKDKKIVLVCVTGQTQNLPVVALRALGYNAHTMKFGYAAWIKGYGGAQLMKGAIGGAETGKFPVEK